MNVLGMARAIPRPAPKAISQPVPERVERDKHADGTCGFRTRKPHTATEHAVAVELGVA